MKSSKKARGIASAASTDEKKPLSWSDAGLALLALVATIGVNFVWGSIGVFWSVGVGAVVFLSPLFIFPAVKENNAAVCYSITALVLGLLFWLVL